MPRRRPAQVRARRPLRLRPGQHVRQLSRVSAQTLRLVAGLERTRFHPGAIAEALDRWARFVHGPARAIADHGNELNPCPCCDELAPEAYRRTLRTALYALPAKAARELLALVRPLDELYLTRSISSPEDADLRDLLTVKQPRSRPPDTFTFTAELVYVGWLLVQVGDSCGQQRMYASDLTPALNDLLAALVTLTEGARHARVSWNGEPTEYRWLISVNAHGHAHVQLLYLSEQASPEDLGSLGFAADLPLRKLVRTVAVAAQALLTKLGEDGYVRQWHGGPFPTGELRALQRWLS